MIIKTDTYDTSQLWVEGAPVFFDNKYNQLSVDGGIPIPGATVHRAPTAGDPELEVTMTFNDPQPALSEHICAVLNRALTSDPVATDKLWQLRVPCNKELADDPTIQVRARGPEDIAPEDEKYFVGPLGLINGFLGVQPGTSMGYIAAVMDVVCIKHGAVGTKGIVEGVKCPTDNCSETMARGATQKFITLPPLCGGN